MEKHNDPAMECGHRDRAVSEIIGAILLIAVVVTSLSIVGVVLWSQPAPEKIPALDAIISEDTGHTMIHLYHGGGDLLSSGDFKILVDGNDYTTSFKKAGVTGWSTWSSGESLDFNYSSYGTTVPALVQIIYTSGAPSSILSAAYFATPGTVVQYSPGIRADYYKDHSWSTLANTSYPARIRFADDEAGKGSKYGDSSYYGDVPGWPNDYVGKTEEFSVRFNGFLRIDTEADYTFHLTSDDGSWLWVDGVQVINNGGDHKPTEKDSAALHLAPGNHPLRVDMYEKTERAVVRLEYSSTNPTMTKTYVTNFYHT